MEFSLQMYVIQKGSTRLLHSDHLGFFIRG